MINEISNLTVPKTSSSSTAVESVKPAASQPAPIVEAVKSVEDAADQTAQAADTQKPQLSLVKQQELQASVSRINEFVQSVQRDLEFSVDDATGRQVISVIDRSSEEVIRQIPSEAVLAIAENIENLKGILFSAEA